jgi:hypothetical protein
MAGESRPHGSVRVRSIQRSIQDQLDRLPEDALLQPPEFRRGHERSRLLWQGTLRLLESQAPQAYALVMAKLERHRLAGRELVLQHVAGVPHASERLALVAGVWEADPGAADKVASLGGESPLPSIAWIGRLGYPMHVPVTVRVLLGRRSHGCPAALGRSGRRDLGGEQTRRPERKEWRRSRNSHRSEVSERIDAGSRPIGGFWGRPTTWGKKQACAPYDPPGSGPKHPGKDLQRNVGKDPLPAGAGRNLQRPLDISAEHEDPAEEGGLAHELVGARTEG